MEPTPCSVPVTGVEASQGVDENLKDEQFDHFYSQGKGRPSLSPTRMLTAIMIQLEKGYLDREMD
ncbi:hypothetical protein [Desulfoscipio gibsoniae]|uniref:hypothetical protein n=1 Tax=Desulfoscipio gibsoniae TaxID=102134 RepID=UPI0012FF1259|nr:hypothetical protein [Desulfoscipio gibsoniae]